VCASIFVDLLSGDCYYVAPFNKKAEDLFIEAAFRLQYATLFALSFYSGKINLRTLVSGLFGPHFQEGGSYRAPARRCKEG
jgi:hypothetical protein